MSNFVVSARKYRPKRFEDVVGQQHVAGTLKNALATDHVAHAFLFTGPRGVGKTTCARILAKVLNCENRSVHNEACNACSSCVSFNENASFNIIELDAASNNSVDHIRALIEQVRFQPQQGKYKVFIIDEVHMLSQQAFNAFLKTLEEPPPYAIFILATTEKHKIIPTILSRCQIFDFRRITPGDMVLHLKNICDKEGIKAEDDALHIIAQKADGALRDALSIFDRITSSSGKKIDYNDVIEHLNVLDYDYYFQITDALLAEDVPEILKLFDQILRKGFEPDVFVNGLAEHLRNILVCKDESTLALLETGDMLRERYRRQAKLAANSFVLTALNLANECDIHFKMARHKRLHVEISLIKMAYIGRTMLAAQLTGPEKKTPDLNLGTENPPPNATPGPQKASNAQELNKDQLATLAGELHAGLKKADKIALSLASFEAAVEVEEQEKARRESKLNFQTATSEWLAYAQVVESKMVRMAFQNARLELHDKLLKAYVKTSIDRNHIQGELMRVMESLRNRLHDPLIKIQVLQEDAPQDDPIPMAPRRPATTREKLEMMIEQNPVVQNLIARLELKPED